MEEEKEVQTLKQKLLFYTTAFFVLLGTFSLFSFLFLVPFVIDPAFTTIFMEFDEHPAWCVTMDAERRLGVSNCSWASCREGCTKDIYQCLQLRVNYKLLPKDFNFSVFPPFEDEIPTTMSSKNRHRRQRRSAPKHLSAYAFMKDDLYGNSDGKDGAPFDEDAIDYALDVEPTGLMGNDSEWYYIGAKLYPNVKGCGYPPMLNCSIWLKRYQDIGTNFSCYHSKVDPGLVISHLDMWQVYMNLVYAMAIPIPSFIVSVIYLTFAYFMIYNDDEETAPLKQHAEPMDAEGESSEDCVPEEQQTNGATSGDSATGGGALTPASEGFREDMASFGHHFKVAMADEMSRESFADGVANSISVPGYVMT